MPGGAFDAALLWLLVAVCTLCGVSAAMLSSMYSSGIAHRRHWRRAGGGGGVLRVVPGALVVDRPYGENACLPPASEARVTWEGGRCAGAEAVVCCGGARAMRLRRREGGGLRAIGVGPGAGVFSAAAGAYGGGVASSTGSEPALASESAGAAGAGGDGGDDGGLAELVLAAGGRLEVAALAVV